MHPKLLAKRILQQMNAHKSFQLHVSIRQETVLGEEREIEEKHIQTTRVLAPETRIYATYDNQHYYIDDDSFLEYQQPDWTPPLSPFQEELKAELRLDELLTKYHDLPLLIQDAIIENEQNQTLIVFDSKHHQGDFFTQVKQQYQKIAPQFHLHHLQYLFVVDEHENICRLFFLAHVFFQQTQLITTLDAQFSDFNQYNDLAHPLPSS